MCRKREKSDLTLKFLSWVMRRVMVVEQGEVQQLGRRAHLRETVQLKVPFIGERKAHRRLLAEWEFPLGRGADRYLTYF